MSFEYNDGKRERVPILLGVAGYAGSGKTYSSCRMATGMQRIIGGDIAVIDTEGKRALQLAGTFKFKHIPFQEPFSSLRYLEVLQFCKSKGASITIVDSMTHEHSSSGGYLDMSEKWMDSHCGEDEAKRHRCLALSLKQAALDRKKLNDWIVHSGMNIIFCYRAKEKMDFKTYKMEGWQVESTSNLIWEMTARFLLMPGSDGKPTLAPEMQCEKMLTKNPEFFRQWCKPGMQLDENLGQMIAEWANEGAVSNLGAQSMRDAINPPVQQQSAPAPQNQPTEPCADLEEQQAQGPKSIEGEIQRFVDSKNNPAKYFTIQMGGKWFGGAKSLPSLVAAKVDFDAKKRIWYRLYYTEKPFESNGKSGINNTICGIEAI